MLVPVVGGGVQHIEAPAHAHTLSSSEIAADWSHSSCLDQIISGY